MSKFKTEFETDRANDQLRNIEVEFDFTPNALASVLYRQGETLILCCITKERALPRWFPRDATKGWIHAEYAAPGINGLEIPSGTKRSEGANSGDRTPHRARSLRLRDRSRGPWPIVPRRRL